MDAWGYEESNGPDEWCKTFPIAKHGKRQSPIDLNSEAAKTEDALRKTPLTWTYIGKNTTNIENTGASWKVNVNGNGSSLSGGGLNGEYELWQFHAHWGSEDCRGSEHTVDGNMYPAELHLVHWNRSKYETPNVAASEPDGLAVVGVFLKVGEKHEEFEKIAKMLKNISFKGESEDFQEPVDPGKFLPKDTSSFWRYEGSLTTPPLLESVIWTVMKEPIEISKEQLETMRSMKTCCKDSANPSGPQMVNNYRPPCPIGNRALKQC